MLKNSLLKQVHYFKCLASHGIEKEEKLKTIRFDKISTLNKEKLS